MPIKHLGHAHDLVRRAKSVLGEVHFRMRMAPRFNYARSSHRVEQRDGEWIFRSEGADGTALRLRTCVPVRIVEGDAAAEFTLRTGESVSFILEEAEAGKTSPSCAPCYVAESFKQTLNFWQQWISRSHYKGRWREIVDRSALTLKLLTSAPHGSMVAAPTFGLPEEIGGVRNWDYRYTWIRDASFTLYGLMRLGYTEEAAAFMHWIEGRCGEHNPDGSLQLMYGLDGHHDLEEESLDHLEGYMKSRPVRIGNGAAQQLQLDIYGELMDSVYLYNKYGEPISYDLWNHLVRLLDWVSKHWRQPDEGIWEVRGGRKEFLYSRLMCWVAMDRGLRLAQKRSFPAPLEQWLRARDEIFHDIYNHFWDEQRQAFVQYRGSHVVDAACLLMPLVKFISPHDPRWIKTLQAIERSLVEDSLVYRYDTEKAAHDGLPGGEGTFSMCSFWYVECLSRSGDLPKARFYFEKALGYANHLGLYAEMIGPLGTQLGNFPQAFTHLALISAAYDLNRGLDAQG
jgi:GH15 family glucan-1,4-alpha-glucosidase